MVPIPLAPKTSSLQSKLKEWLKNSKKIVVAGIGNPIRMDDSAGVKIVRDLRGRVSEKVYLIECETVPENFIQKISSLNPTHILLIDAAMLGSKPGHSKLIFPEHLAIFPAISTHALPLKLFCDLISSATKAKIALLLIQPGNIGFGEGLTPEVEKSTKKIVEILLRVLP